MSKEKIMEYIESVKNANKEEKEKMYFEVANMVLSLVNSQKCKSKDQKKLSILFLAISIVEASLLTKDICTIMAKYNEVDGSQGEQIDFDLWGDLT